MISIRLSFVDKDKWVHVICGQLFSRAFLSCNSVDIDVLLTGTLIDTEPKKCSIYFLSVEFYTYSKTVFKLFSRLRSNFIVLGITRCCYNTRYLVIKI